jgi:hypothetical protein
MFTELKERRVIITHASLIYGWEGRFPVRLRVAGGTRLEGVDATERRG